MPYFESIMVDSNDVRLGRIEGILETFAMLNAGFNEDYTFSFVPLSEGANLEDSVRHHLYSQ